MINLTTFEVLDCPTLEEGVKFLKTQFRSNELRFEERFLKPLTQWLSMNEIRNFDKIVALYRELFQQYSPYSYRDAMAIQNDTFRAKVFSVIDVPEMIKNLGHKRIEVEGIELVNRLWSEAKQDFIEEKLTQIYELHEVNGEKLGLSQPLYAIKCWCTSTNNEHWLWCDERRAPLEAIASLCRVYKPMLGKIKNIIRQGDVFLFEMREPVDLNEDDEVIPLTKEQYFSLLTSQS